MVYSCIMQLKIVALTELSLWKKKKREETNYGLLLCIMKLKIVALKELSLRKKREGMNYGLILYYEIKDHSIERVKFMGEKEKRQGSWRIVKDVEKSIKEWVKSLRKKK